MVGVLLCTGCGGEPERGRAQAESHVDSLVDVSSGLPDGTGPSAGHTDSGPLEASARVRMLIGFPLRDESGLEQLLRELYDPASPRFRAYLSAREFNARYGPLPADTAAVESWLSDQGLTIRYTASNHLIIQVDGSADQFNQAFGITLHSYEFPAGSGVYYYGTGTPPKAPPQIASRIAALLVAMAVPAGADADTDGCSGLAPDDGKVSTTAPTDGVDVATIQQAYQVDKLKGATGRGVRVGIVAGGAVRVSDIQSFWQGQGIVRSNPVVRRVLDAPCQYNAEATLDTQWAGALAPGAKLILYQGADWYDASVAYLFNEAIGAGEVQVVTTSFSHNEKSRHPALLLQHDYAARMAAALGITVLAASGDSAQVDLPAACPYVTAVGGTSLTDTGETAWTDSGSGPSRTFAKPWYQQSLPDLAREPQRATGDVALNADQMIYYFDGQYDQASGTSFATPALAGIIATLDSARAARGLPAAGFLNPLLYSTPAVQRALHDITSGGTPDHRAGVGWDYPTGWGTPDAAALATALP